MTQTAPVPQTAEALRVELLRRYEDLSKRLQQIGRYVLDHPNDLALETLAVISARCGVQPSAIVRFAKTLGFEGASQMQRLFRDELMQGNASLGYSERVRQLKDSVEAQVVADPSRLLHEFVEGNVLALNGLSRTVSEADIRHAVELIARADTVYVLGYRRAFPVSSYIAYSLLQADKRTCFVDGAGGLAQRHMRTLTPKDLLIAVSFQPYAQEIVVAVETAVERGAKILAISDSLVSPIAKPADQVLQVRESDVRGFRSLSASMCLAQALVIAYAFEQTVKTRPKRTRKSSN